MEASQEVETDRQEAHVLRTKAATACRLVRADIPGGQGSSAADTIAACEWRLFQTAFWLLLGSAVVAGVSNCFNLSIYLRLFLDYCLPYVQLSSGLGPRAGSGQVLPLQSQRGCPGLFG